MIAGEKQMLFSLNGVDFAANYGKLESSYRFYKGSMQTMAHWSDEDGGGRFTVLVSQYFIHQLKQWMKGEGSTSLNIPVPAYNKYYHNSKSKISGNYRPWMLYENVYNNIGIIYRGKHTQTVGIQRSIKVPRISMSGKPYGEISVAKYAMINEFGGKFHKAQPLFGPAMVKFIAQHFPPMVNAVKKAFLSAYKAKEGAEPAVSSQGIGSASDVMGAASLGAMQRVANSNPERDFKKDMFSEDLHVGSSIGGSTKALNKSGQVINRRVRDEMVAWAKSQGMSMNQLHEFLSTGKK